MSHDEVSARIYTGDRGLVVAKYIILIVIVVACTCSFGSLS